MANVTLEERVLDEMVTEFGDIPAEDLPHLREALQKTLGYQSRVLHAALLELRRRVWRDIQHMFRPSPPGSN